MNRFLGIILFLLWAGSSAAQLKNKGDAAFNEALQAFKQERYDKAMTGFSVLAKDYTNQERSMYAHYFYANAAERTDKDKEGWNMLQQLISRYPNWAQKDEVYYLAGVLNFKLKNYYRGLDYLNRISTSAFQKDVGGLKQRYLAEVKEVATLKGLHKQFPDDRIVASYLVKGINNHTPPNKSDEELARSLASRFKLSANELVAPVEQKEEKRTGRRESADKKYHNVAVLLPYRIDSFDPASRNRSNQYVFDYYQGLLLAQKQLKKENIDVRLNAYDISNIKNSVSNLTNTEDFKSADLILGPLHPETSEEAAEYSRKTGVPVINPLSTDSKLLTDRYPRYFLAHASLSMQARQLAQVARSIDPAVKAMIYYGESSKDSALAVYYAEEIKAMNGQVLGSVRLGATSEAIAPVLMNNGATGATHVALFSTDPRAGRAFLNLMRGAGYERTPLVATATGFDRYNTDFSVFGREVYLLDTDFIDYERKDVKTFQYEYYQANNTLPSVYSYLGYDHLLFFGRKLDKFKDKVGEGITQNRYSDRQGYLLGGFDYRSTRENAIFSVRKYQGNTWVSLDGIAGN